MNVTFEVVDCTLPKDQYGESCGVSRQIKIDLKKHKSQEQVNATLLHEKLHAILAVTGLNQLLEENLEEAIVIALEHGLEPSEHGLEYGSM